METTPPQPLAGFRIGVTAARRAEEQVSLLERRGAYLYHACQFGDFLSYLELGGIPSRQRLEEDLHYFTGFTTDEVDQDNRVWDKVFVNLEDFGRAFASGLRAGPARGFMASTSSIGCCPRTSGPGSPRFARPRCRSPASPRAARCH
mgnify:CR=1 FL=1